MSSDCTSREAFSRALSPAGGDGCDSERSMICVGSAAQLSSLFSF